MSDNNQTVHLSVINQTKEAITLDPGDIVATLQLLVGQDEVCEAMFDYNKEAPEHNNEMQRVHNFGYWATYPVTRSLVEM